MSDSSIPAGGHRPGGGPHRGGGSGRTGSGGRGSGGARSGPPRGRSGPSRPPQGDPAREAALDTLRAVREDDAYANLVLPRMLRERRLHGRDAALATDLAYGACRARGLLDAVLAACCDRPLDALDGVVLDALRLGAQQLLRTRIPAHAAVAASVDLVRARAGSKPTGFVNAVLRRVSERDEAAWVAALAPDAAEDPVGHLALAHAHPRWIAAVFADALGVDPTTAEGRDELAAALAADDTRPAVHLAARPGEISAEELAAVTGGELAPGSPYGVLLVEGGDPGELEAVREGLATVQDEGSQLVAVAAARAPVLPDGPPRPGEPRSGESRPNEARPDEPRPDEPRPDEPRPDEPRPDEPRDDRWLDLCAGPGGKAVLLGALAGLSGATLDALDRAPHRAALVEKATSGLGVRVHVGDARDVELPEQAYDRVLVDAPCSGLGALRRRPEARWRRSVADVDDLAALQRELLTVALDRVRPGGVVTYATCSPHPSETVDVVTAVAAATGAELLDSAALLPEVAGTTPAHGGPGVQLWPHRHGTDAMFFAVLRRPPR